MAGWTIDSVTAIVPKIHIRAPEQHCSGARSFFGAGMLNLPRRALFPLSYRMR